MRRRDTMGAALFCAAAAAARASAVAAVLGGRPLPRPPVLRSAGGELNVTLRVQVSRLGDDPPHPVAWNRRSYDGRAVGPTIVVRPGDTLRVTLVNELGDEKPNLIGQYYERRFERHTDNGTNRSGVWTQDWAVFMYPNVTNLHTHGLHVSPAGDSDNVRRRCGPGETLQYTYAIPESHPEGLFWYHPHYEQSSGLQILSGMFGALIVAAAAPGAAEDVLVLHEVSHTAKTTLRTHLLCYFCYDPFAWATGDRLPLGKVVRDADFERCSNIKLLNGTWASAAQSLGLTADCTYLLVNGEYRPQLAFAAGATRRWRIVQSSHQSTLRFTVPGCSLTVVALDGLTLAAPRPADDIVLPAGARADVDVLCATPGEYALTALPGGTHRSTVTPWTKELYEPVMHAPDARYAAHNTIATLRVAPPPAAAPAPPPAPAPCGAACESLLDAVPASTWTVVYNMTAFGALTADPLLNKVESFVNGGQFSINGESFTGRPVRCMQRGTVEEWKVVNAVNYVSRWMHSFHIHVNPFQIVSVDRGLPGQLAEEDLRRGDWRDTVVVPAGGSVTLRMRLADFVGVFPFHCHVTAHQDLGMMQYVEVVEDLSQCSTSSSE